MFDSGRINDIFTNSGADRAIYIIAEVGINHNGSLDTALKLIHAAKKAGADAVKFQKRELKEIYSPLVLKDSNSAEWIFEYLIPLLKEVELSRDDYGRIREECDRLQIDLIVTPLDHVSAKFVAELGVSAFKIASADMTNIPLLRVCNSYDLPMLVSVGMWNETDISKCVKLFDKEGFRFALLLAQSTYPASYETLNLGYLERLKELAPVVGYSGHERGTFIPVAAAAMGCRIIEKHITFDKNDKGPDHKASMLPDEWEEMVFHLRMLEKALSKGKQVNQAEKLCKEAFAKSAVPVCDLLAGHILTKTDIIFRSPGKGLFPHEIERYIGKTLTRPVRKNHYINATDFEEIVPISDWKHFLFKKMWGVKCRFHDYEKFRILNTPCIEFHCSQTDLDVDFHTERSDSLLVLHAPEIFDRQLVDLCSDDSKRVDDSLKILQRSIDKTLEIAKFFPAHKPKLVMHLGGMFLDNHKIGNTSLLTEKAIENFSRLKYCKTDLDVLPENLPPRPWYLGGEWFQHGFMLEDDMSTFCSHFGIGMAYDICHASLYCNKFNVDLNEYTAKILPFVTHIHISDALGNNGEGVQVGDGTIDFDKLMVLLKANEFSWVPEIWSGHLYEGSGVYKALNRLEKYAGIL
ncbi:N-acetylneuraminate synthase family protein [Desulforhopalus singaporensis]|uniref:N-acetylneuraminate synthase n=1 Tax=Desulforhopalus singaporensis TaxID=91360 RepID=A0A1H0QR17_9BACT|nr:N-acetylneuraminate synthase family protein [Desulforhopalus singaporensis]SDP19630.1 N-acetylneuraminate synthase [Desulforhopalus singaporensis]